MVYKTYTRQMIADFTGRPVASFPEAFINASAIPQALLLFKLGTCLAAPDGLTDDEKQMVDFAILSMADAIHLVAPYQAAIASPFNSESIGSYSYSKTAKAIQNGLETGIGWFDMALDKLSVCETLTFMSGGIEVFEHGHNIAGGSLGGQSGNLRFLGPVDIDASRRFGYDPAPGYPVYPLPVGGGTSTPEPDGDDLVPSPDNPGYWELP